MVSACCSTYPPLYKGKEVATSQCVSKSHQVLPQDLVAKALGKAIGSHIWLANVAASSLVGFHPPKPTGLTTIAKAQLSDAQTQLEAAYIEKHLRRMLKGL